MANKLQDREPNPRRGHNLHQWLSTDGRRFLDLRIAEILIVARLSTTMAEFKAKFAHVYKGESLQTSLCGVA